MMNRLLTKFTLRLLDTRKRVDYLLLCLFCGLPSLLAIILGIGDSVEVGGKTYVGWFDKSNFWPFVLVQPVGLYILRISFQRIANISTETVPAKPPPLISLFRHRDSTQEIYSLMRGWISSPKVMGGALLVSLLIQIADLRELVGVFIADAPARASELDWSVMYQAGLISKETNILFNVSAYLTQFSITTLGIWGMSFLIAHNLFFLSRIYQRSRVSSNDIKNFITLDLEDVNRCFGFRAANDGFNTQIVALSIAGFVIMMSRFANVTGFENQLTLELLLIGSADLQISVFPDIGQILLAVGWVIAVGIVTLPALVKLTPRLPVVGALSELSIDTYLREFLTDEQWTYGDKPNEKQTNYMAAKFARNGFWPTGDNRASSLFFFSFWVSLIILYPVKTGDMRILIPSLLILGVIAYFMRTILLKILHGSLSYVDERLTTPNPELLREHEEGEVHISSKVFISYRREDSLAYSRLLRQSLSQYMAEDSLFMDITTIRDGEDFVQAIEDAISACDSVIVVIGPTWSSCTDDQGVRRLEKGDDFVRLEVATSIAESKLVVPVLVGNAKMPSADELTADIAELWRRHARELSDSRWEYDVGELAKTLAEAD